MLRAAMQKVYCSVHNSSFEDTDVQHSDAEGAYLTESVNLVLTDHREQNRNNSAHDVLSEDDMNRFGEVVQELLARGGHGAVFRSSYQYRPWFQLLASRQEKDEEHLKITNNSHKTVFTLERKPLKFLEARKIPHHT